MPSEPADRTEYSSETGDSRSGVARAECGRVAPAPADAVGLVDADGCCRAGGCGGRGEARGDAPQYPCDSDFGRKATGCGDGERVEPRAGIGCARGDASRAPRCAAEAADGWSLGLGNGS
jgi:hypothetical protein